MIQFNLLPDVKQKYMKTVRLKRTAIVVSLLITISSLTVFVLLFISVRFLQKNHIARVENDIKLNAKELNETPNLNKILTIQNQINSLPDLHEKKPLASRLSGYLYKITPSEVYIGEFETDFEQKTMKAVGTANSLESVNKFVDTIKFTTYVELDEKNEPIPGTEGKPFSDVVLSSFTRTSTEVTYEITFSYNEIIFDNNKNIMLIVPKRTTTRSETEKPSDLFKDLPKVEQSR